MLHVRVVEELQSFHDTLPGSFSSYFPVSLFSITLHFAALGL